MGPSSRDPAPEPPEPADAGPGGEPLAGTVTNRLDGVTVLGSVVQAGTIGGIHLVVTPPPPPPRQVPPLRRSLIDRSDAQARVRRIIERAAGAAGIVAVIAVTGPTGVGKTALARHLIHTLTQDSATVRGHVHVDCGNRAAHPGSVLPGWLCAAGVPPERQPTRVPDLPAAWRTVTASGQIAVLIDGAPYGQPILDLLPGGGVAIVTSRAPLSALAVDGADVLTLDPLPPGAAVELLQAAAGRPRDRHAPGWGEAYLRDLAAGCGRLPLQLATAGAYLATHPTATPADLNTRIHRPPQPTRPGSDPHDDESEPTIMAIAYTDLPEPHALAFRQLAAHPGTHPFRIDAAAAIIRQPPARTADILDALAAARLLEPTTAPTDITADDATDDATDHAADAATDKATDAATDKATDAATGAAAGATRYAFPGDRHQYAQLRAETHDTEHDRTAALGRALTYYAHASARAAHQVRPSLCSYTDFWLATTSATPAAREDGGEDGGEAAAWAWLDAEQPTLMACLHAARRQHRHHTVVHYVEILWAWLQTRRAMHDWETAAHAGVTSADALGDPALSARMRGLLTMCYRLQHRNEAALDTGVQMRSHAQRSGDPLLEISAAEHLAAAHHALGDPDAALFAVEEGIAICDATANTTANTTSGHLARPEAMILRWYATILSSAHHRHAEAHAALDRALELLAHIGDQHRIGRTLGLRAEIHLRQNQPQQALAAALAGEPLISPANHWHRAEILILAAEAERQLDHPDKATHHANAAIDLLTDAGATTAHPLIQRAHAAAP